MAFTQSAVELSRRAAKIMGVISRERRDKILPFITIATSWDNLPKWVQDIIMEEEEELKKNPGYINRR